MNFATWKEANPISIGASGIFNCLCLLFAIILTSCSTTEKQLSQGTGTLHRASSTPTISATPTTPVATSSKTPRPPTPTPTFTVHPDVRASWTSTPQPPLQAHTWQVEQILVQIEDGGGDGHFYPVYPPDLVLYADGLFLKAVQTKYFNYEMHGRVLTRQEICAFLNTFDQNGFLDYDPSVYRDPMDGLSATFINVNAWKSQNIIGQLLDYWVYKGGDWWIKECPPEEGCYPPPVILPALANTVKLLDNYDPDGLQRIRAENMVIWALPEEEISIGEGIPKTWPVTEISLQEIVQVASQVESYSMVVSDPAAVKALEAYVSSGFYKEGDLQRYIFIRPLWPAETHFGIYAPAIPEPAPVVPPGTTLSCGPDDGTIIIPEQ